MVQKNTINPNASSKNFSLWLRAGIAFALIVVILQWVDLGEVAQSILHADMRYVPVLIALALFDRFLMAYKWAALLRAKGIVISNAEAFRIYLVSGFVGTFLPTGIGADVYKLARTTKGGARLDKVAASIFMERALGLLAISVLAIAGLSFLVLDHETQFLGLYYFAWVVFFGVLVALYVTSRTSVSSWLNNRFSRFNHYRLIRAIFDSHKAYTELGHYKSILAWFFLLSLLEHCILSILCFVAAQAVGLPITIVYFFAIIPVTTLLGTVPITIAGLGVQEALCILLFSLAGLSPTQSLSLSIFLRGLDLFMLVPGAMLLFIDSMGISRIQDTE